MVVMSTHDESLHPRGQAANAGQFRTKENSAPADALTRPAPSREEVTMRAREAADAARTSAYYANSRAIAAEVEQLMAEILETAPDDAAYAIVHFDEDDWEGAYPRARWLEDADGEQVDDLDDVPLHSITTDGEMEAAGFERVVSDGGGEVSATLWRIPIREPKVDIDGPAGKADTHLIHTRAAILGQGGNGFADMLIAATVSDEGASNALGRLDRSDLIVLTRHYEEFMASIADEVKRRDPSDEEAQRRAMAPF